MHALNVRFKSAISAIFLIFPIIAATLAAPLLHLQLEMQGQSAHGKRNGASTAASARIVPAAADGNWFGEVQKKIAAKEYEASRTDDGLQAPNRRHNLRTYFDEKGIRVHDRTAGGSPELLRLTLSAIGRSAVGSLSAMGDAVPAGQGEVRSEGNRVEIGRGNVTEWYINNLEGLEQGFDIRKRPEGTGELSLALAVEGATAALENGKIVLTSATGRKLEYKELKVVDRDNRPVPASFKLATGKPALKTVVVIAINDEAASYPIFVDPLITAARDALLESNQAYAGLGASVSGAGDVNGDGYADVIVGAPYYDNGLTDEGAAFVYYGSEAGISTIASAMLEADQAGAAFGASVSGAGDVNGDGYSDVIVGAPGYDNGGTDAGAAFVYHGGAGGISRVASATLQSNQADAAFGRSVSGAGDVNGDGYSDVIVGAPGYDYGETDEGAAFVYLGGAGGVSPVAYTMLEANQAGASFGASVSGAGDVNADGYGDVIVGAPYYDNGQTNEGAAFVYHGEAGGISTVAAVMLESNQGPSAFGASVSGAGDVNGDGYADVIVGAPYYDNGEPDEGAAFVYRGSPTGISTDASALLESNQAASGFGTSVSGAGDVNGDGYADVIVGAPHYDNGQTDEGAAFVYQGTPAGTSTVASAMIESNQADAAFGTSVSGAGDVNGDGYADVIVGSPGYDNGQTDEGAAFMYHGGAEGISAVAAAVLEGNRNGAAFGASVSGAGDVNGDGYPDVIVGAPDYDYGLVAHYGAAFVYHGSAAGISTVAAVMLESHQADANFGYSVSGAGDVNGDGYADVIIGAPLYDNGQTDEGAAFVYYGSAAGISAAASTMLEGNQAYANFGSSVSGAGDVNGDGYADVIVGATNYDNVQYNEGAAFVYYGSAAGISTVAPTKLESNQVNAAFGASVSGAGDVNGDGYADVIVGAFLYDNGQAAEEGATFVYHGSAAGISTVASAMLESNQANAYFGYSVSGAGDVNGDGYADVIVGAPHYDNGQADEGAAFVYYGSAAGIPAVSSSMLESNQAGANFGHSVSGAGDVNGDGYADVIVGAPYYDNGESNEGTAFVYHGGRGGISTAASAMLEANQASAYFGISVSGAGDVNGDGYADVIVGAEYGNSGQFSGGLAFVYHGNKNARPVLARQTRGNGNTTPVQPWGVSYDPDDFQVKLTAVSASGPGLAKMQVETCPVGAPFSDPSCGLFTSSVWTAVTTSSGATLTETIPGLSAGKLYKWRARVLHAPYTGITLPPNPAHGPWRRLYGGAEAADILMDDVTAPLTMAAPMDRGAYDDGSVTFNWTQGSDPDTGVVSYDLQIGTTPGGNNVFNGSVGNVLTYTVTGSDGQTFYARVRAVNPHRLAGIWSTNSDGITIDTSGPSTPAAPTDAGTFSTSASVTFNWSAAADAQSGIADYNLQVGTAPGGSDVYNGSVGNVLTYTVTGSNGQTLYARVQAVNGAGTAGSWSANSDGITVDTTAPSTLPAPADAGAYSAANVTFNWTAATDAQSGIAGYNLQVGTTPGGSDMFDGFAGNVLTYTVFGSEGQTLYARVQAVNGAGTAGNWSANSDGVTIDTSGPTTLAAPTDTGAYSTSTGVIFSWSAATDAQSGISGYNLQVGTTPGGSNVYSGSAGNVLTYTVTGLNGQTLYARVQAVNGAGTAGSWSASSDGIMIDTSGPTTPAAPADAGTYSASPNVTFTWSAATDAQSGVTGYNLQIGTTPGGNDVYNGSVGNVLTYTVTGSDGQALYARVQAVNGAGTAGNWSATSDGITIDTSAPSAPGTPTDTGIYSAATVTFTWFAATDAGSGISGYNLQIGTTPGGNDVYNGSVGNVLMYTVTGSGGQILYARVQAVNGAGTTGSWSANSDGITIDTSAPSTPDAPTDAGAYSPSASVTFTWSAAGDTGSGIAGYNLQVGTTPGGSDVYNGSVGNVLTYTATGSNGQTLYARVQAVNGAGTAGNWSANSDGIMIDTSAPTTPAAPADAGTYSASPSVAFTWTAAADAQSGIAGYNLQVGTTPGGSDVYNGSAGNVLTYTVTGSDGQTLYARVQAVNRAGTTGSWSASSDGITIDTTAPSAPGTPTDAGTYSASTSVTFNWSAATDVGSGVSGYNLQIGTTPGGSDVYNGSVGNVLTYTATGSNGQTLYARVQAVNGAGTAGNWSANSDGIMIDTSAPTTPAAPADAGTYSASPSVTFTWFAAADTQSGIAGYNLQVGTTPGGSDVYNGSAGNVLTYTVTGSDGQTLYARVQAVNGAGTAGSWTANSDGITIDTSAPSTPAAPTDAGAYSPSASVTFNWSAATDTGSGIMSYNLQVGTAPGGSDVYNGSTGNDLTYTVTGSNGQTLYARVQAVNRAGTAGGWSASSDGITVDTTAPSAPSTPADAGTYSASPSVAFTWTAAADAQSGIAGYNLQVGTTPGGSDVYNGNAGNVLTYTVTGSDGQTLYARVQAVNGTGTTGSWSANSDGITIDISAPSGPGTPTDAGTYSASPSVTFSWSAAIDAGSGISGYNLQVGTTPGGSDVYNGSAGNVLTYTVAGSDGQTLYARVQAVNGAGTTGNWSANSDGITIDTSAPSTPAAPADAGAYSAATVTFTWSAASDSGSGIAGYNLQVGTTPGGSDVYNGNAGNVLTYTVTGSDGQTLYARVQAVNGAGTTGNWSTNSDGITIDTSAPAPPAAPTDAGTYSRSASVTFNWSAASDTQSGTVSYNLQVGTTPGGSDVYSGSVGDVLNYTVTGSDGQTLYARVQAVNGAGTAGNWSTNSDGITIDTVPPTINSSAYIDSTHIDITFNEQVTGAAVAANYSANNGLAISNAVLQGGNTYRLTTSGQAIGTTYTVTANTSNIADPAGNSLSSSANTVSFTRTADTNSAPSTPTISSPLSSSEMTTLTPTIAINASTDPDGDPVNYTYEIYSSATLTESSLMARATTSATGWQTDVALSDNTTYYWRVQATDGYSNSLWTATANFFVNTANDNPTEPGISSPADNSEVATLTPVLSVTNAEDVDKYDILTYDFEVATDSGFTNIVTSITGTAQGNDGVTSWISAALSDNTTYYWRARAVDNHGGASNWVTAAFFINTANDAPSAPVISSPANTSEVTTLTPVLVVDNATDADHDHLYYTFEIDTVNTFDRNKQTSGTMFEVTNWTLAALSDNTTYYWRAKANDGQADGPWTTTASFFVNTANDAPSAPTLKNPSDNGQVTVLTPTLSVNAATDIDHDSLAYDFEVYSDSNLASLVTSTTGAGTSWTVNQALYDNTTYWWRARARDEHGAASSWMAASSFFVNNNGTNDPPSIIVNKPGASEPIVYGNSYTITWTALDPDSVAVIMLGYDTTGAGCNGTQIVTDINENDGTGSYAWNITNLAPGTYYVYASISDGVSTKCAYGAGPIIRSNATGDLDGDGDVDTVDALKALRIAAGLLSPTAADIAHGDVAPIGNGEPNPDGKIGIGDAVVILRKSVGLVSW